MYILNKYIKKLYTYNIYIARVPSHHAMELSSGSPLGLQQRMFLNQIAMGGHMLTEGGTEKNQRRFYRLESVSIYISNLS